MVRHPSLNLKAAVEREKAVQAIDVHRECKNCVVTFWVMSQFLHFLGASRGCADFRDPTAVFRLNDVLGCSAVLWCVLKFLVNLPTSLVGLFLSPYVRRVLRNGGQEYFE